MHILSAQALELFAGQSVGLNIFDPGFDLTLVARHTRFGRQDHGAIMLAERPNLGVEFRFEPIDLFDRRTQIVDDQFPYDPAKVPQRVL